jgi:NAD(P)-dependent dehydrogenase (short-subunit alcohol dehydrogenase family)
VAFVKEFASRQGVTQKEFKKNRAARMPLKRTVTPEDVVKAVAYLASEETSDPISDIFNISGILVMD